MPASGGPLISIITPSLNHAAYLRDTIESVLAQDWPHIEHIVVDGGSTDGTVKILEEYGRRYPERFRWVSEPDRGQSEAFNKGLAMAGGTLIGWQNSDDYYYPHALSTAARYIQTHPEIAMVYASCHYLSPTGAIVGTWRAKPYRFASLLETNFIPNQSSLIRKSALLDVGGLDTSMRYAMDYDLWLRLGMHSKLMRLSGVWGVFRRLPGALTATGWLSNRLETVAALKRLASSPALTPNRRQQAAAAVHHNIFEAILVSLLEGADPIADTLLQDALRDDPALREWPDMRRRLLGRSYADRPLHDREPTRNLCHAMLSLLHRNDMSMSHHAQSVVSISYLKTLLDTHPSRSTREILAYVMRALQTDHQVLRHRPIIGIAARVLLGDARAFTLEALVKQPWDSIGSRTIGSTYDVAATNTAVSWPIAHCVGA